MRPKYPGIRVPLVGEDGNNAFAILSRTQRALGDAGVPQDEIDRFAAEAASGDYEHLLAAIMRWVEVVDDLEGDGQVFEEDEDKE